MDKTDYPFGSLGWHFLQMSEASRFKLMSDAWERKQRVYMETHPEYIPVTLLGESI